MCFKEIKKSLENHVREALKKYVNKVVKYNLDKSEKDARDLSFLICDYIQRKEFYKNCKYVVNTIIIKKGYNKAAAKAFVIWDKSKDGYVYIAEENAEFSVIVSIYVLTISDENEHETN